MSFFVARKASAGGGGGSFSSDPFSAYTNNYIADTTFAGTAGNTTTVSWNGGTISGPTYSTAQAAITAAAAHLVSSSVPTRVCLLAGQTYINSNIPLFIPSNTGTIATAANPFVIQGDPASTASTMPIISGNGGTEGGFAIGCAPGGSLYAGSNDNRNTVIRKLEITNYVSTSGANAAIYGVCPSTGGSGRFSGLIVEYCKIHKFVYSSTAGEGGSGPFYIPAVPSNTDTFEVRYCKVYDSIGTDGTTDSKPFAAFETYGGSFNIHHNEVYLCPTFFSGKVLTSTVPNGTLHHNLVHDCGNNGSGMIEGEAGGEGNGFDGLYVYNNLFYWTGLDNAHYGTPASNSCYNDTGANGNTTAPTDIRFYNNTFVQALGNVSNPTLWNINTTAVQIYNNVILGSTPFVVREDLHLGTYSFCDYNVYFNPSTFYLNLNGSPQSVGSFAAWQTAHTNNPTFAGLAADPDAHGINIGALSVSWNTIAANFPNNASNDYTIAAGSPLKGAGQGGVDPGYNPADCGPGW